MAKTKKAAGKKRKQLVTPVGRLNFVYLAKPDSGREHSDDKYHADIIFSMDDFKNSDAGKALRQEVLRVGRKHYEDSSLTLKDFKNPFKKGNDHKDVSTEAYKVYKDSIYITPKSEFAPGVYGPDKREFTPEEVAQIKSGDYGRAVVVVYPYTQQGGGVTMGLQSLQFAKKGAPLGGSGKAAALAVLDELEIDLDDFEDDDEEDDDEEAPVKKKGKSSKKKKKVVEEEEDEEDDDEEEEDEEDDDEEYVKKTTPKKGKKKRRDVEEEDLEDLDI